jgi:hypothetical protein
MLLTRGSLASPASDPDAENLRVEIGGARGYALAYPAMGKLPSAPMEHSDEF